MLDFSHVPNVQNGADTQIFNALGINDWQTWMRPRGKTMANFILIGSGAGGGGGFSAAAATARGGGGGGGSSSLTRINNVVLDTLPSLLFINVGLGGLGGAASVAGSAGQFSLISIRPDAVVQNRVAYSGASQAGGGGAVLLLWALRVLLVLPQDFNRWDHFLDFHRLRALQAALAGLWLAGRVWLLLGALLR
jgi:hypothetical protein